MIYGNLKEGWSGWGCRSPTLPGDLQDKYVLLFSLLQQKQKMLPKVQGVVVAVAIIFLMKFLSVSSQGILAYIQIMAMQLV